MSELFTLVIYARDALLLLCFLYVAGFVLALGFSRALKIYNMPIVAFTATLNFVKPDGMDDSYKQEEPTNREMT